MFSRIQKLPLNYTISPEVNLSSNVSTTCICLLPIVSVVLARTGGLKSPSVSTACFAINPMAAFSLRVSACACRAKLARAFRSRIRLKLRSLKVRPLGIKPSHTKSRLVLVVNQVHGSCNEKMIIPLTAELRARTRTIIAKASEVGTSGVSVILFLQLVDMYPCRGTPHGTSLVHL